MTALERIFVLLVAVCVGIVAFAGASLWIAPTFKLFAIELAFAVLLALFALTASPRGRDVKRG